MLASRQRFERGIDVRLNGILDADRIPTRQDDGHRNARGAGCIQHEAIAAPQPFERQRQATETILDVPDLNPRGRRSDSGRSRSPSATLLGQPGQVLIVGRTVRRIPISRSLAGFQAG